MVTAIINYVLPTVNTVLFDRRRYLRHYSIIVCSCEWAFADTFSCHLLAEVKGLFLEINNISIRNDDIRNSVETLHVMEFCGKTKIKRFFSHLV